MAPTTVKPEQWKSSKKYRPEEVKEAIANMPTGEQHRRVGPVLGAIAMNVAHRVRENLGEPGAAIVGEAARALSKQVGGDLSPEAIDLTTVELKDLLVHLYGGDDVRSMDDDLASAVYYAMAALLMKLSCDVLDQLGDEKGQHVIEQAWEEIAKQDMYWELVSDQFDLEQMDAKAAIALLAGTDALMGVQFDLGKMTPTYAERNITFCTPVAMAWKMGYSHETVRKFCETVATSVCIRGPQTLLPGIKIKYLTRMSYGDHSCIEVAEVDEEAIKRANDPAAKKPKAKAETKRR